MEQRTERVVFETDRHRVEGDITLPREGYRSRFSDYMNRADVHFIPLTDVSVSPLDGGEAQRLPFLAVGRPHIRLAHSQES